MTATAALYGPQGAVRGSPGALVLPAGRQRRLAHERAARRAAADRAAQRAEQLRRAQVAALVGGPAGRARWYGTARAVVAAGAVRGMSAFTVRLAARLLHYADHDRGDDIRPTWDRLAADLRVHRRTVARHLALLVLAGLLERREGGRHTTLAEFLATGRARHAAVYALALPAQALPLQVADHWAVDNSDRPADCPAVGGSPNPRCATPPPFVVGPGGTGETPPVPPGPKPPVDTPGTREGQLPGHGLTAERRRFAPHLAEVRASPSSRRQARYALAEALQRAQPMFAGERTSALAHALRNVAAANWTVADVVAELDTQPLPTKPHPDPSLAARGITVSAVLWPARFLARRMDLADLATPPATLQAARAAADATAAEVELARRRAELAADQAAAIPLALSSAADAWTDLRTALRRRTLGSRLRRSR